MSIGSNPIIPDISMPQVDNSIFLPIIMSLFKCCSLSYGFILVYVFYPFVTKIKIKYAFFSKIKQKFLHFCTINFFNIGHKISAVIAVFEVIWIFLWLEQ